MGNVAFTRMAGTKRENRKSDAEWKTPSDFPVGAFRANPHREGHGEPCDSIHVPRDAAITHHIAAGEVLHAVRFAAPKVLLHHSHAVSAAGTS